MASRKNSASVWTGARPPSPPSSSSSSSSSLSCQVTGGQTGVFLVLPCWPPASWENSSHDSGLKFLVNLAKPGLSVLCCCLPKPYQMKISLFLASELERTTFLSRYAPQRGPESLRWFASVCLRKKQSTPYFQGSWVPWWWHHWFSCALIEV